MVKEAKQVLEQHHSRVVLFDKEGKPLAEPTTEKIDVYKITIESLDFRMTDVLLRAISAVLHSWQHEVGNAAQNILTEQGRWENDVPPAPPENKDVTQDPSKPPLTGPSGTGNG